MEGFDLSRRDLMKAGGAAVLLGGAAATFSGTNDEELPRLPGKSHHEHFRDDSNDIPRTVSVNRGLAEVGLSMPGEDNVVGMMCGDQSGEGYVEHRFVASHLSYAIEEQSRESVPITANDFAQGIVQAGTIGDSSGCGSLEVVPNYQIIAPFEVDKFLSGSSRSINPDQAYQNFKKSVQSELTGNQDQGKSITTAIFLVAEAAILASQAGVYVSKYTGRPLLGLAASTIVFSAEVVDYLLPDGPEPTEGFYFNSDKLRHVAKHQDSSGLFYMLDFSVRVPYETAAYVDVEQSVDFYESDIPNMFPARISPTKRSRLHIPAIDPPDDGNPTPKPAQFRPNYWEPDTLGENWNDGPGIESTTLAAFDLNQRVFTADEVTSQTALSLDPSPAVHSNDTPTNAIPRLHGDRSKYEGTSFDDGPPLANYEWRIEKDTTAVDRSPAPPNGQADVYHTTPPLGKGHIYESLLQQTELADSRTFEEKSPGMDDPDILAAPAEEFYPRWRDFVEAAGPANSPIAIPDAIGELELNLQDNYEEGFYTASLTARNDDGLMDRMEKSFAVGKPVLPIVDYPEPVPIDNEVTFRGYVTGPRADEVDVLDDDTWHWEVQVLGEGGEAVAAGDGTEFDVTFERAVAHKVSLTVTVTGDETVTRHFKVRPSVEGSVVNIYPSERPVPVGKEVTWRADLHMPTDHEPTVDETPTWTLRKATARRRSRRSRPRPRTNIVTISRTSRTNQRGNLSTPI